MSKEYPVRVAPIFNDPNYILDFFEQEGFYTFSRFSVFDDCMFIYFPEIQEAEAFVHYFNQLKIAGVTLQVTFERPEHVDIPSYSDRKRGETIISRTLAIRGYPPQLLTDRNLYNDFWKYGYLKQIEIKKSVGYLQYDTESDAANAIHEKNGTFVNGEKIFVECIPDKALNVPNILVPLVIAENTRIQKDRENLPHD
ncbi:26S protease regulatory subunit 4 [Histomonas meleagridis]|uniref:26S protease regulatory subunit 4 n=1 Tax=Histomonas meleagridis TaxID=135588 RepID=UPI00355A6F15|nr:26S protease regulatory subunit 4 [Histomonas meleagridis]KAH0800169.1 26S protease regulatory subunit 4 [Histomonas meleagridis]